MTTHNTPTEPRSARWSRRRPDLKADVQGGKRTLNFRAVRCCICCARRGSARHHARRVVRTHLNPLIAGQIGCNPSGSSAVSTLIIAGIAPQGRSPRSAVRRRRRSQTRPFPREVAVGVGRACPSCGTGRVRAGRIGACRSLYGQAAARSALGGRRYVQRSQADASPSARAAVVEDPRGGSSRRWVPAGNPRRLDLRYLNHGSGVFRAVVCRHLAPVGRWASSWRIARGQDDVRMLGRASPSPPV